MTRTQLAILTVALVWLGWAITDPGMSACLQRPHSADTCHWSLQR